ncbi:DeoR family transcriptional regulator [Streptomyces triticagri]|uniref:DeoR family transcriptional regulator n=1 Tax=Streptomyces triticagri TaxID=2293568 RepID=A0A372LXY5_9ACTN|nr:substrate-binding domain-containing protein [Streptomyces triticagri]RFU83491.1 DeoR family transcriptional regulator [Streptomyces triticagri]
MREPVGTRRQRILGVVRSRGTVRVSDLAAELEVSVVTVRRDVEELAREGRLRRGHGVAQSVLPVPEAGSAPADGEGDPAGDAVALVVPAHHSYLYETLHGARETLEAAGAKVTLYLAPQAPGAEQPMVEAALAQGAQGLLIAPRWRRAAEEAVDEAWLADVPVPTVIMERRPRPGSALHPVDSVCSDHWYGVHLAVDRLTALGHRRIVLAARDDSPTARAVRAAFAAIVAEHPLVEDSTVMLSSSDSGAPAGSEGAGAELAEVLKERGATAALLHGDVDALMLVQQLTALGVRVPEQCSVISYDDVVAAMGTTPLTAVSPPKAETGRVAARLLLRRLRRPAGAAPEPVHRVELVPRLVDRGSVVAPA